jgi:L,D-peptidoglycan transpeptidase YkuD (ErfK/YbiS/YcfS/YnhG family)
MEGDGTTPTGSYGIGPVMYGIGPDPGVAYHWRHLVCGDWWDEDPASSLYNRFVHLPCGETPPFGGDSEALWTEAPAYDAFAVIEYNVEPTLPGRGSAIFLHEGFGAATTGCVALAAPQLVETLRWLRPADSPRITIAEVGGTST